MKMKFKYILVFILLLEVCMSSKAKSCADSTIVDSLSIWKEMKLKEITVVGQNMHQYGNKTTVYLTKDLRKNASNLSQVFGKLPNFYYDIAERKLTYNSSSNILVLVDGVEKNMDMILNMQHVKYSRVEIIDHPQGRYRGYDVVLSLLTKKDYEGYELWVHHANLFNLNSQEAKKLSTDEENGSFTYTKNRWNFNVWYHSYFEQNAYDLWTDKNYLLNGLSESTMINGNRERNQVSFVRQQRGNVSIDYMFCDKTSLSFTYAFTGDGNNKYQNNTMFRNYENGNNSVILQNVKSRSNNYEHSFALFYRNEANKMKYYVDFNYRYLPSTPRNLLTENYGFSLDNNFRDRMDYTRFRINAETSWLNGHIPFSFGYINTWKKYVRKDRVTSEQLNRNSYFRNNFWTGIGYVCDDGVRIEANAWLEHVYLKSGVVKANQIPLGGNLMAFYKWGKRNWMRFTYDCDVEYPDQSLSSEYGYFTDSLVWQGGNPKLKTNVTHSFKYWIDLWHCFNFQMGYKYAPNRFCPIAFEREGMQKNGEPERYVAYVSQNIHYENYWASVSLTKHLGKAFTYKLDSKFQHVKASFEGFSNHGNCLETKTSLDYYNEKLKLGLQLMYIYLRDVTVAPQSKQVRTFEHPALTINKSLLNDKLEVSLKYAVMFHLFKRGKDVKIEKSPYIYNKVVDNAFDRQRNRLVLSVEYLFGGGKSVRQYKRELSNER